MIPGAPILSTRLPSVRQMRAFHAIAGTQSISAAASEIRLSQPALSQSLKKLEDRMGARLFDRQATGAYLTPQGRILLRRVARMRARMAPLFAAADESAPDPDDSRIWHLTLPQIRAVLAVAEAGSFTAAARRLGISEASVHQAARDLETLLGRSLYHRTMDGIALNRHGSEVARQLRLALGELEQVFDELAQPEGAAGGRITIGSLPMARTLILPRAINRLGRLHPNAVVHLVDGPYDVLLSDLRGGRIDVLIGALRAPPPADDVVEEEMLQDGFAVVARSGHPLLQLAAPAIEDLARHDWIIARKGTPIRAAFEELFAECANPPAASVETSSLVAIRGLLVESDKLTLLSRRQIIFEEELGLLGTLALRLPHPERAIGASVRVNWLPTPLQASFMQILREECRASAAMREPS